MTKAHPNRSKAIFELRMVEKWPFSRIADHFGVSRQRVWQVFWAQFTREAQKWRTYGEDKARVKGHDLERWVQNGRNQRYFVTKCSICGLKGCLTDRLALEGRVFQEECQGPVSG